MGPVPLHDVEDIEGYVRAALRRLGFSLSRDEREELVAEGIVELLTLGSKYQQRMDGYERDGSFAGWASKLLPLKIISAWHRMHEEHVLRTQADKTRVWEYHDPPDSWDAKIEANEHTSGAIGIHVVKDSVAFREDLIRLPGNFVQTHQPPKEAAA